MNILSEVVATAKNVNTGYKIGKAVEKITTYGIGIGTVAEAKEDMTTEATTEMASEVTSEILAEEGANIFVEVLSFFFE